MTLLVDTSAVVSLVERANESVASPVRTGGNRPYVSFITIAELHVEVAVSPDAPTRAARQRTLSRAQRFRRLPIEDPILTTTPRHGAPGYEVTMHGSPPQLTRPTPPWSPPTRCSHDEPKPWSRSSASQARTERGAGDR
jgi:hypothetical protein